MTSLREIKDAVLHLLFPHVCTACGRDIHGKDTVLCMRCVDSMPETGYAIHPNNPVEKIFRGRLPIQAATAQFYFSKESLMQELMHQFKYKGNIELGVQLGKMMGIQMKRSGRFMADALVPLPLFPAREKRRGYNQATILCQGIAAIMQIPVLDKVIFRPHHTETQTRKGRIERWKNMDGKFVLNNSNAINGKHLILVDDVITTGATIEACGTELIKSDNTSISIASLCVASR